MQDTTMTAKRMISIRMDEELLSLLEGVSKKRGTLYFDRDRTWLIEHAVKQQYGFFVNQEKNSGGAKEAS